jgi:hypothetical protein
MTKPIAVCGYRCEAFADKLKTVGLNAEACQVHSNSDVGEFLDGLSWITVAVFIVPPAPHTLGPGEFDEETFWSEVGVCVALGKQCVVDTTFRPNLSPKPFLAGRDGNTMICSSFQNLTQFLLETC